MRAPLTRHYLDHASTTPLRPAAVAAMAEWLERLGTPDGAGDPARVHEEGRLAREAVEVARSQVAALGGVPPNRVVFTSGGTEAVNTALAAAGPGSRVLCSRVEHSSVRKAADRAGTLVEVEVGPDSTLDLEHLAVLLASAPNGEVVVNCQWANHEVGTVQPLGAVAELCTAHGARLHVDAAAAFGHVPTDLAALDATFVSLSAHKMGGPSGVGALVLGRGVRLRPLLVGGSEERARRAGAENLLGIVGFGAAAASLLEDDRLLDEHARAAAQRDALAEAAEAAGGVRRLGPGPERLLPHIVGALVEDVLGEAVLLGLDRAGVAAHSGSSCSSEVLEPSPVLEAMGVDPDRSLRLSVGWSTTDDDVSAFASCFPEVLRRLRELKRTPGGGPS
ncbi:MAG TPA: cysteine desulfurase family protein [Acidimicrobiales bacterium]|nr:cysteine desulfurase family protein [Acidimicrobiales bacterium]